MNSYVRLIDTSDDDKVLFDANLFEEDDREAHLSVPDDSGSDTTTGTGTGTENGSRGSENGRINDNLLTSLPKRDIVKKHTNIEDEGNSKREDDDESEHDDERKDDDETEDKTPEIDDIAFNPGSKPGKVRGNLVYANFGLENDFQILKELGITIEGSILMMKYHSSVPGLEVAESDKIQMAYENKAIGIIFISDPESMNELYKFDDMTSIEKQSVGSTLFESGNLVSPGNEVFNRIPDTYEVGPLWDASKATPKIPTIPISMKDAIGILDSIKGRGKRIDKWDMKFPSDENKYEIWTGDNKSDGEGGGDGKVIELNNEVQEIMNKEMWNVIGKIEGIEQSSLGIIIGAQRDSSSCEGAIMPNSGTAVLIELMTVLSLMVHKLKWRPLRTIQFVSFDGADYNLAGSTFFVRQRERELRRHCYAYIDLSDSVSGIDELEINADPLLWSATEEVLKQVEDPISNQTLFDYSWKNKKNFHYMTNQNKNSLPFIQHVGVPSIEIKYKNSKDKGGGYPIHSCSDSFKNFQKNDIDPGMKYHKVLSEVIIKLMLQLVEKPIIPFDIVGLVSGINGYAKDLKQYSFDQISALQGGDFKLDFNKLETSLIKLKSIGREHIAFIETWSDIVNAGSGIEPSLLSVNRWDWNAKISLVEKSMLAMSGTLGRPWNRNVLFGRQLRIPLKTDESSGNLISRYEYTTFPGVRDALERGDWANAQAQLDMVTDLLDQCIKYFMA
ncbi:unnamed protein product [[Candida] boidinii]|nr:unnamed protein product [[Candida] boidinii]